MRLIQRYSPLTLRSDWRLCLLLVMGVLWVSPLSAQQTVVVPDVNVVVDPTPITIENNVQVMSDSAMVANFNANMEAFRAYLEQERECNTCGGANTTTKIAVGVIIPVLVWIALELRGIKNKEHPAHPEPKPETESEPEEQYGESE